MTASRRTGERGAALLLVMVAVAVLTALAVDLAYDARVTLRIAANGRDELRASYAAKGGVELARLVLALQKQIDGQLGGGMAVNPAAATSGGAAAAAGNATAAGSLAAAIPRPLLWRLVPVDSALAAALFGGGGSAEAPLDFHAKIDDEAAKVNVQLDGTGGDLAIQLKALYALLCDPRWDAIFDREDDKGNRVSRQDLLVYLHDWIDELRQDSSALDAQFPMGTCEILLTGPPFRPAGGDRNQPYDKGPDRYRTKNARMDSLDELYLVAGVDDVFMAAFGDAMTVYLPRSSSKMSVNGDPGLLLERAKLIASPASLARLQDPAFAEELRSMVGQVTFGGLFAIPGQRFTEIVQGLGVTLDPSATGPNSPLTDTSNVYRIRSEARSGAVTKRLDVVLRLDKAENPAGGTTATTASGTTAAVPGQLALGLPMHWREE